MPFLNKYENAIIAYIASVIKFNSNIVYIKPESICAILHTDKVYTRDFYPAIRHLTNLNIIYKTEYQSYYAVNPLAVFKGSLVEFVENYNTYIQSYNSVAIDDKIMLNRFAIEYKNGNNKIFKVYENKNSALKSIKVDKAKLRAVDEPIEIYEAKETDNKELPKFNGKKISFKFWNCNDSLDKAGVFFCFWIKDNANKHYNDNNENDKKDAFDNNNKMVLIGVLVITKKEIIIQMTLTKIMVVKTIIKIMIVGVMIL